MTELSNQGKIGTLPIFLVFYPTNSVTMVFSPLGDPVVLSPRQLRWYAASRQYHLSVSLVNNLEFSLDPIN